MTAAISVAQDSAFPPRILITATGIALVAGTRVGAFIEQASLGASDWNTGVANFTAVTGITVPVTRVYFGSGSFPTNNTNLNQIVASGIRVCITLRPDVGTLNPAHLAGIDTMLAFYKAAGADFRITLNHEPFFGGITAADYVAAVKYYGPTVRKYFPLWCCFSGDDAIEANGYFPGDGWVDGIAVDAYCPNANAQTFINNAAAMADNHGLPLGLWEFNGGTDLGLNPVSGGQSPSDIGAYFTFIQTFFAARTAAGKPNGDIILFSASGGTTGTTNFFGWSGSQQGGFEGGNGTWIASNNCAVANTAVQARSGTKSLQLTSSAAGNMSAISCSSGQVITGSGLPVVAGQHVIGSAFFRAATVGRNCHLTVAFHDATGAALSSLSGSDVANITTDWTRVTCDVVAPASAAFARLSPVVVSTGAGSEVHYVDDPEIAVIGTLDHTSPIQYPWDFRIAALSTLKAALDNTSLTQGAITIYREFGGVRTPVRGADDISVTDTALVRNDGEYPFGLPLTYVLTINGVDVATASITPTLPGGKVVISDAITGLAVETVVTAWPERDSPRTLTRFVVGGRNVVVSQPRSGAESQVEILTETSDARDQLLDLLANTTSGIVLLRAPDSGIYPGYDGHYFVLGDTEKLYVQRGSDERRLFTLDVLESDPWAASLLASGFTLADIEDSYPSGTLGDIQADFTTLLDIEVRDWSQGAPA